MHKVIKKIYSPIKLHIVKMKTLEPANLKEMERKRIFSALHSSDQTFINNPLKLSSYSLLLK